jgi:membrane glycosyltransferase
MADVSLSATTVAPAEWQMTARRVLFAVLVLGTIAGCVWAGALTLAPGGLGTLDIALLVLFAITLPWSVLGFWNSLIGFVIMRFARSEAAAVVPGLARIRADDPLTASTAVLICIRNEAPERVLRNLEPMLAGFSEAGVGARFHIYILSDTSDAAVAAREDALFARIADAWRGKVALTYRRREINTGYKAGNIRDFCERWGAGHDFAITLDTDSVMSAAAAIRLARVMQASPRLGILQGLVIGMPATSAMARLFQFGMRLGMRSYTLGSAWWQGDCGPYWGHNAIIRLKPFIADCEMPLLPGGVHVLSHDQIEAVMMRRAGYEVRVLPEEDLGFEENPTTLNEFVRRDLRWCQGNLQYLQLISMPRLKFLSRCQLAIAIVMFLGSPAWVGLIALGTIGAALSPGAFADPAWGWPLFWFVLAMWQTPKLTTAIDVLLRSDLRRGFGGTARVIASLVCEFVFYTLLLPITWLSHTIVMGGLLVGYSVTWGAQARDDHTVSWSAAAKVFWPHTLCGLAIFVTLALFNPAALLVAVVVAGGLVVAIPMAVLTASPAFGRMLMRAGIGRLPEETAPPPILRALALPALAGRRNA